MELLIALKPIRLNGDLLQPREMFRVVDGQPLTDRGYARKLTEEETSAILGEYVAYAEALFSRRSMATVEPQKNKRPFPTQEELWTRGVSNDD